MTLEEKKRRLAELQAATGQQPEAAPMSLEAKKARLAQLQQQTGAAAAPAVEPAKEATLWENVKHVAAGVPQVTADILDLPHHITTAAGAVSNMFPEASEKYREINPGITSGLPAKEGRYAPIPRTTDLPGLRQAREYLTAEQEGAAPAAEYARTAVEWGAGGIPKLFQKGASAVPDIAMAIGAGGGQAAGDAVTGDDTGAGELTGALTGLMAGLRKGDSGSFTKNQQVILDTIREQFEDPEAAVAAIRQRVDTGEIGTLADLSRELGVADMEAFMMRLPKSRRRQAGTEEGRIQQIFDETLAPLQTAEPTARARYVTERAVRGEAADARQAAARGKEAAANETQRLTRAVDAEMSQADATAARAQTKADTAVETVDVNKEVLNPGGRPDEYSSRASGRYNAAEKDHADNVTRPLWKAFDEGPDIQSFQFKAEKDDFLQGLDPSEADALLDSKYGKYFKTIDNWQDTVSPRGLTLAIQEMKDDINNAFSTGSGGFRERKLQELVNRYETMLADPTVSQEYARAVAATKEGYDRFGPEYIGDVRKGPPETMLGQAGLTGDRGAATARLIDEAKVPELQSDVADYIRADAVRQKNLDEQFLIKYEAVLDNLPPQVRQELVGFIESRYTAEAAQGVAEAAKKKAADTRKAGGTRQEQLSKALAAEEKTIDTRLSAVNEGLDASARGKFAQGGDVANDVIDKALETPTGVDDLKSLMDDMTTSTDVDAFKTAVKERMERKLFQFDQTDGVATNIEARSNAYRDFQDMKRRLVDSGVLTEADANRMESTLERTTASKLRQSARAYDLTKKADEHINLMASAGAAAVLGPIPGAYSLMVGGAVRRAIANVLKSKQTEKRLDILDDYLNNPKKYLEDLDSAKTEEEATRMLLTKLVGASQAAEILGGE